MTPKPSTTSDTYSRPPEDCPRRLRCPQHCLVVWAPNFCNSASAGLSFDLDGSVSITDTLPLLLPLCHSGSAGSVSQISIALPLRLRHAARCAIEQLWRVGLTVV